MDFAFVVRRRLTELGIEQRVLAAAARVTDSYISQLLTGKKAPPNPERTDIYARMEGFLHLPAGHLAALANIQRTDALKRKLAEPPAPFFKEVRGLVLDKCVSEHVHAVRTVFEKEPFGALERLVMQKLLDVVQRVTQEELKDDDWLRRVAQLTNRSHAQMRVMVLDFLETDVFNLSTENCLTFFDPLIESWTVDLETFGIEVVLNRRLAPRPPKRIEFVERDALPGGLEPGLRDFLADPALCRDATEGEINFLKTLTFTSRRPTPLYYYRALQDLRDPLHFRDESTDLTGTDAPASATRTSRAKNA